MNCFCGTFLSGAAPNGSLAIVCTKHISLPAMLFAPSPFLLQERNFKRKPCNLPNIAKQRLAESLMTSLMTLPDLCDAKVEKSLITLSGICSTQVWIVSNDL